MARKNGTADWFTSGKKKEECFLITFSVVTSQKISNSSSTCCVRQSTWFILRSRNTRPSRKNTRATRYYFTLFTLILNFYHRTALQQSTANSMNSKKKYTDALSLPRNRWRSADSCLSFFLFSTFCSLCFLTITPIL